MLLPSFTFMVIITVSMIGNAPDVVVIKILPQLLLLHNMYVTICNGLLMLDNYNKYIL